MRLVLIVTPKEVSGYYGEALSQEEGQKVIKMAVDGGCTVIDTSFLSVREMVRARLA